MGQVARTLGYYFCSSTLFYICMSVPVCISGWLTLLWTDLSQLFSEIPSYFIIPYFLFLFLRCFIRICWLDFRVLLKRGPFSRANRMKEEKKTLSFMRPWQKMVFIGVSTFSASSFFCVAWYIRLFYWQTPLSHRVVVKEDYPQINVCVRLFSLLLTQEEKLS